MISMLPAALQNGGTETQTTVSKAGAKLETSHEFNWEERGNLRPRHPPAPARPTAPAEMCGAALGHCAGEEPHGAKKGAGGRERPPDPPELPNMQNRSSV